MIHKEVRLFFLLLIYTKQETPSRLGRRFLFRLPLIKGRIESVEILGVQPVGEDAQALTEMIHLSNSRQTQCFLGFGGFFVFRKNDPDQGIPLPYFAKSKGELMPYVKSRHLY